MSQFDRLGNDMSESIAEGAAWDEDTRIAALVAAVKKHAQDNYERDGWDMVVECYEDSEIAEEVAGCNTAEEAIALLGEIAGAYDDRRKDAQAEAGDPDQNRQDYIDAQLESMQDDFGVGENSSYRSDYEGDDDSYDFSAENPTRRYCDEKTYWVAEGGMTQPWYVAGWFVVSCQDERTKCGINEDIPF